MALASCMRVNRAADRYKTKPVPVYRTLLKMYRAMEEAGLIQRELTEPKDACAGCVSCRNGTCRREYREAEMGFKDEKIVRCTGFNKRVSPIPAPPEVKVRAERAGDLCDGCCESVNGTCVLGYRAAVLDESRTKVVECRLRRERRQERSRPFPTDPGEKTGTVQTAPYRREMKA